MSTIGAIAWICFVLLIVTLTGFSVYYVWVIGDILQRQGFGAIDLPIYIGTVLKYNVYLVCMIVIGQIIAANIGD